MALTLLQMYAAVSATADGVASIDIPEDGEIVGIDWDLVARSGWNTDEAMEVQLSFLATAQFTTNDARGAISSISIGIGALATNGVPGGLHASKYVGMPEGLDVAGGERLHLHSLETGSVNAEVRCLIHLKTRRPTARRTRRRR